MGAFRIYLVVMFLAISGYTAVVAAEHGLGLIPVFFGDMAAMGWPGQFNLDFMCFLSLSALWLAWRHHFTPAGLLLGVLGFFGGALFLSVYLLVVSFQEGVDFRVMLLGRARAAG